MLGFKGFIDIKIKLVENARKFRESAPNQILIFGEPPPQVGVSENVGFFKVELYIRQAVLIRGHP